MPFPQERPRRLRKSEAVRELVAETVLAASNLVVPYFVVEGRGVKTPIPSMPGQYHFSVDALLTELDTLPPLGLKAILLFGVPEMKDEQGESAAQADGLAQQAVRAIKEQCPELVVITDVCLCAYTTHGHCGVVKQTKQGTDEVMNDESLALLARTALSHARAGADFVAPSDMMDGRVRAIRTMLDEHGFDDVGIMSYAAKYASAFYGPFRDAVHSAPQYGSRASYQMDARNVREALREIALDIEEGADIIMVKPALAYLDVIRAAREQCNVPIAAYNVSGEYAMVKAAAEAGWVDERSVTREILTAMKRAGARLIISYHAKTIAQQLRDEQRKAVIPETAEGGYPGSRP